MTHPDLPPMDRDDIAPELNALTWEILGCALEVHSQYGSGLLERLYQLSLAAKLRRRGIGVEVEVPIDVDDGEVVVPAAFRLDLIVDEKVVIEVKSVEEVNPVHLH